MSERKDKEIRFLRDGASHLQHFVDNLTWGSPLGCEVTQLDNFSQVISLVKKDTKYTLPYDFVTDLGYNNLQWFRFHCPSFNVLPPSWGTLLVGSKDKSTSSPWNIFNGSLGAIFYLQVMHMDVKKFTQRFTAFISMAGVHNKKVLAARYNLLKKGLLEEIVVSLNSNQIPPTLSDHKIAIPTLVNQAAQLPGFVSYAMQQATGNGKPHEHVIRATVVKLKGGLFPKHSLWLEENWQERNAQLSVSERKELFLLRYISDDRRHRWEANFPEKLKK